MCTEPRDTVEKDDKTMLKYAFWNNKGGTGKTSLNFQSILGYARKNSGQRILALDLCPQANLSELLLGGLVGEGGKNLLQLQGGNPRATVGGYFQMRLPSPYTPPKISPQSFLVTPNDYNSHVPSNVDLLAGDALLELQSTAVSTLANANIPGQNSWLAVIDWLRDFTNEIEEDYDVAFIDCNPSFSMYTQIALSITDRLVIPVMADDSSRRALENAFSLIYGLHLPSNIYAQHNFATRLNHAGRSLPKVHLIVKNRLTQYMGPASAYEAVLRTIDARLDELMTSHPEFFTFNAPKDGVCNMRDFGTTGVVAHAKGQAFADTAAGRHNISGRRVSVKQEYRRDAIKAMAGLLQRL